MRQISIQESDSDDWKKWIQDCEVKAKTHITEVAKDEKPTISDLYKREKIKEIHFVNGNVPFYGRCAYCDGIFGICEVEHFRPKAGIQDADGKVIHYQNSQGQKILDKAGKPQPHLGYYWLAYDWRNLLPSCGDCNRYKGTKFPVIGYHAQSPGDEVTEKPLLINPISDRPDDHPENHLAVEPNGVIHAVNNSDRGKMCINIFKLNREQLIERRKKIKESIDYQISIINQTLSELNIPQIPEKDTYEKLIGKYERLINIIEGSEEYTMARRAYLHNKGYTTAWLNERRQIFLDLLSKLDHK
jgi:hypothetical protein